MVAAGPQAMPRASLLGWPSAGRPARHTPARPHARRVVHVCSAVESRRGCRCMCGQGCVPLEGRWGGHRELINGDQGMGEGWVGDSLYARGGIGCGVWGVRGAGCGVAGTAQWQHVHGLRRTQQPAAGPVGASMPGGCRVDTICCGRQKVRGVRRSRMGMIESPGPEAERGGRERNGRRHVPQRWDTGRVGGARRLAAWGGRSLTRQLPAGSHASWLPQLSGGTGGSSARWGASSSPGRRAPPRARSTAAGGSAEGAESARGHANPGRRAG